MEDFQKTIKKGETFNILACSLIKQKIDSLPHPYLRKGDRSQYSPLAIQENIRENFLKGLEPLIDKTKWTLIISNEALFNSMKGIAGFSPFIHYKDENGEMVPTVFERILEEFKIYSKLMEKTILIFNFVYTKTKIFDHDQKNKIATNLKRSFVASTILK